MSDLFDVDIEARPLEVSLKDYQLAPSGEGKVSEAWKNKPHRIVYDLIAAVKYYASMQGEAVAKIVYDRRTDENGNTYHKSRPQVWPLIADAELLAYPHSTQLFTYPPSASAEIARLTKELEGARKDVEWQSIETAPKDGTLLMVYSRTHGYVAAWWDQVDGGGHPENGPPVYWWVSDHCEFTDGPYDAPVMWRHLNELSDVLVAAISKIGGGE